MYKTFTFLFVVGSAYGQSAGDYRTAASGNWNDINTWQTFDGADWVAASSTPTSTDGVITLMDGHTVTVPSGFSVTVDQVEFENNFSGSTGILTVAAGGTLIVNNGTGDDIRLLNDFTTFARLDVFGTLQLNTGATIVDDDYFNLGIGAGPVTADTYKVYSGGTHIHTTGAGVAPIPAADWQAGSTCQINATSGAVPTIDPAITFHHFTWNGTAQTALGNLAGGLRNLNGDLTVTGTNNQVLQLSTTTSYTLNIGRDFLIQGNSRVQLATTASPVAINITRDFTISSTNTSTNAISFNATGTNTTVTVTGNFSKSNASSVSLVAGTTGTSSLNLLGNFSLTGGTITRNASVSSGAATINFNGASVRTFTNTGTISNAVNFAIASAKTLDLGTSAITGSGSFTLNGTMRIGSTDAGGALQLAGGTGNLRNTGARTFASGSTVVYNGTGPQFIGDGFPSSGGDVNLTIDNANNVSLSDDLEIVALRTLTLTSGNLVIGNQTLTINGTVTGSGGMVGGATSNLVIGGTGNFGTLTFSGTNQLLNFTINRTSSGLVTLGDDLTILGTFTQTAGDLAIGANTFMISGAFARTSGNLATTSSSTVIVDGTGSLPAAVGFSGTNLGTLTLNRSGAVLTTTASIAITNLNLTEGTFGNGTGIAITAGGTITRTDLGSMNNSPNNTTNTYNVVYNISGPISTGVELPSSTTALGNLTMTGSATLTLASDITINGTLTLSSGSFNAGSNAIDMKGNFVSNASSTLTSSTITFSGTTVISGSSTPTFGGITITGTLTPSSSFRINGNLVNNGTLNAGSATTIFGGTTVISGSSVCSFNNITISGVLTAPGGSMNVAGTFTNNGTFTHNNGTVVFNGTSSVAGTSTTNFRHITISGTLNAPATLTLAGDFVNNGTFNRGTGTVLFNGTTIQNINGSVVTDFNNINVTNTAGPPSVRVVSNQNLRGVLTLASNATFDADGAGSAIFTLISTSDDPTSDASIAALPSGASVTGSVTVQRYMSIEGPNGGRIYRFISSPVQTPAVSQIQTEIPITGPFTGSSACSGCGTTASMYRYDETVAGTSGAGYLGFPAASNTETLATGSGYSMYVRTNIDPVLSAGSARWDVRAPINSGTITFPATFTSTGSGSGDGWNLVGNPYPSTIDWDAASGWTRTGINNAIYMRDNAQEVNASYVGGVGVNGGSRYIAIGQAFFVKSDGGPVTFQATENVKVAGTQTSYLREIPQEIVRVTLRNGEMRDEMVVRFKESATDEFDGQWDAYKFSNAKLNLSSLTPAGKRLSINSLSGDIDCSRAVKLAIDDVEAGSYQLDFTEFENISNGVRIELFDAYTGNSVNIRATSVYPFEVTSDTSSFGEFRFELRFHKFDPVTITADGTTLTSSYSAGNQWYLDGEKISGATGQTIEVKESGVYEVEVIVKGCSARAAREMLITGNEFESNRGIKFYPNPVTDELTIELPDTGTAVSAEIVSSVGQPLGAAQFVQEGSNLKGRMDLRGVSPGLYVLKIVQGKKTTNYKVIKK